MKNLLNINSFKKRREQELMSNRNGKAIFTSFNSRNSDYFTH